jgi:hypothetical protein
MSPDPLNTVTGLGPVTNGNQPLLPCPFCGATTETKLPEVGVSHAVSLHSYGDYLYRVECEACGGAGPGDFAPGKAIAAWSRRVQPNRPQ